MEPPSASADIKIQEPPAKKITCPKCHTVPLITFDENSLTNLLITCKRCNIEEEKEEIFNLLYSKSKFTQDFIPECSNSKKHGSSLAEKFCSDCKLYFCKNCLSFHEQIIGDSHNLISPELSPFSKCSIHYITNTLYCHTCMKEICNVCCKDDHSEHSTIVIKDLVNETFIENFRKNLKLAKEKVEVKNLQLKEKESEKIKNEINNIENEYKEKIKKLTEEKDKIINQLNEYLTKLNKLYDNNKKINSSFIDFLNVLINSYKKEDKDYFNFNNSVNLINFSNMNIDVINIDSASKEEIIKYFDSDYIIKKHYDKEKFIPFLGDPRNLKFKYNIATNRYNCFSVNVFLFKTIKNELLLAYSTTNNDIVIYDITLEKIVHTLSKPHSTDIVLCKHYYDRYISKNDLLISASRDDTLKVWNITKNYENIISINQINSSRNPYLSNVIYDFEKNSLYLLTCGRDGTPKIWNWNGQFERNFAESVSNYKKDSKTFHDGINNKSYVIFLTFNDVRAYEFKTGQLYKKFDGSSTTYRFGLFIYEINNILTLIESDDNGNIRFWNFHEGTLIKKINVNHKIMGMTIWNDQYIITGSNDTQIHIIDVNNASIAKSLSGHSGYSRGVCKINHPKYGESIITYGLDSNIKLWTL